MNKQEIDSYIETYITTGDRSITGAELKVLFNAMNNYYIGNIYEGTYAEITLLVNNNLLQIGKMYQITDYATKHQIVNTEIIHTGSIEPLNLIAISNNQFAKIVFSTIFPADYIEYSFLDNLCEDGITIRKGNITYRRDTILNLSTYYDFRNIKFMRKNLIFPEWNAEIQYGLSILVKVGNIVYKSKQGDTSKPVPEIGISPIDNTRDWIKLFDLSYNLGWFMEELTSTKNLNIGYLLNTNITYNNDLYYYTFSNPDGEENSLMYRNIHIGKHSFLNNIVFTENTINNTYDVNLSDGCYNITFGKQIQNFKIKNCGYNNIFYDYILNCEQHQPKYNILGKISFSIFDVPFQHNVIEIISLSHFTSEFLYNDINFINNIVTGSDIWGNSIENIIYSNLAFSFRYNYAGYLQECNFLSLVSECQFPSTKENMNLRITTLKPITMVNFPNNASNFTIDCVIEFSADWSSYDLSNGTIIPGTNSPVLVKINLTDNGFSFTSLI